MHDDQLRAKPFNLDAAAIAWVRDTLRRLSPDDKIRQLFTLNSMGLDAATLTAQQQFRAGGITRRHSPDLAAEREILEAFDRAGLIGEGEHTRAIVDNDRLMSGAAKRAC